ncbi:MAG TPA: hypothetical protein P5235_11410 [Saprospiraceae bacterium]|nr:hypothetical protein [Saprospiraceae bacterium]
MLFRGLIMFVFLFRFLNLSSQCDETLRLDSLRNSYHTISDKQSLTDFLQKYQSDTCFVNKAYIASATMMKAQYTFLPNKKWSYFIKGKKIIENTIASHPENLELRYIRYLIQSNIPSFLGYKSNIDEDLEYISSNLEDTNYNQDFKNLILANTIKNK